MRIATWNTNSRKPKGDESSARRHLMDTVGVDVALFQEAGPFDPGDCLIGELIDGRSFGSAVEVTRSLHASRVEFDQTHPGASIVVDVVVPEWEKPLTVISIYGVLERTLHTEFSITTLHRQLSDLTQFLDYRAERPVVLGGDLNVSLAWDAKQRGGDTHRLLLERIEAFGLTSVLPYRDGGPQTYRHNTGDTPWQLDYLFVSDALVDRVSGPRVVDDEVVRSLSDHNPIVIDLEI